MSQVSIRWINHAGYVLSHRGTSLVVDPWLEGSVFDDGWDLISPTRFAPQDWDQVTHIWFSHEHPDHFHPPSLMSIPETARDNIQVLFQNTPDHRVARWCAGRFGNVCELGPTEWIDIGDELRVRCVPHDNGDSWLAVDTPEGLVLNLNDCVVSTRAECETILELIGRPAVLLSQFSYANWTANPGDTRSMVAATDEKLGWLRTQIEVLQPAVTIPFASYVWFSHEDNVHLNEGRLTIAETVARLQDCDTNIQVLYPGDRWPIGEADFPLGVAAVERYDKDMADRMEGDLRTGTTIGRPELVRAARQWGQRLRDKNGWITRLLPPARVWVWDHEHGFLLDQSGLRESNLGPDRCDISVRSDALAAVFDQEYGGRTLDINGRFTVPANGRYTRFKVYATLAAFNARGESWSEILATIVRRGSLRIGQRISSLWS